MIDLTSALGARALQRFQEDLFFWLTTIDAAGCPQPRPVWFIWDGQDFLVYSQPNTRKLQQIERNPNVAIHFDGGAMGFDVQVIHAMAEIIINPMPAHHVNEYSLKYRDQIRMMWRTEEDFSKELSIAIRLHPKRLRGTVAPV